LVPGHASAEMHWVLETCTLNDSFQMQPWIWENENFLLLCFEEE
jgi:hypothetical protein